MADARDKLRIGIVAGEESGDLLAADLVRSLKQHSGSLELVGVGGRHLIELGLSPLFDASRIALMGVTAVLRDLPALLWRIDRTAKAIIAARPDCLITVDSPDFSLRVARKVKAALPQLPVIHYVCPSVWAWRPGRAQQIRAYVDHVLCLLPFEPEALQRLNGPAGTFVGHRFSRDPDIGATAHIQLARPDRPAGEAKRLLVLPGSRPGEVKRLAQPFGESVNILHERGNDFSVAIPTLPGVADLIEQAGREWAVQPQILLEPQDKWSAFAEADAAIAASGTVLLELALCRVPSVSCYQTDAISRLALGMITTWTAALPNLVADRPIVPEYFDSYMRPGVIARMIERLWSNGPARTAQLDGFNDVARAMHVQEPPGEHAADIVLSHL